MSTEGVKLDMELPLDCSGQNLEGFAVILYSTASRSRHMSQQSQILSVKRELRKFAVIF